MFIIKKNQGKEYAAPASYATNEQLRLAGSKIVQEILAELSKEQSYPKKIAKKLGKHEQTIYYHMRKMEKANLITPVKQERKGGTIATLYQPVNCAYVFYGGEMQETRKSVFATNQSEFFLPFVENGRLNARIIVGSPDPHGPEKARSRDGYYGMDFALFLGTFLTSALQLNVFLDTETTILEGNLILVGGPVVNKITAKFNEHLPIRFQDSGIYSSMSGKHYHTNETGLIAKIQNPFSKDKWVLVIAGKRFSGTRATILAFLQEFESIKKGNIHDLNVHAKVVEGVDLNSDGIVDSVEILE